MWLQELFKNVLHMSFTGSFVILLVLIARVFLHKVPKIYSYILWAIVLFRLLCPVSFTSEWSLMPRALAEYQGSSEEITGDEDIGAEVISGESEMEDLSVSFRQENGWQGMSSEERVIINSSEHMEVTVPEEKRSELPVRAQMPISLDIMDILCLIWVAGIAALAIYSANSLRKLRRKTKCAVRFKENTFQCDYIETPFTLGVFVPKIYLPSGLAESEIEYITAHEKHHIKRLDHIIKPVAYMTLCIHWFNPLVWLSFILAGKDMEMSCDEAVMAQVNEDIRAAYSTSLLRLSTGNRRIAIAPLAFGEGNVKARIKNVMNYKKPSFWAAVVSLVVCVWLGISLCSNPEPSEEVLQKSDISEETVISSEESVEEPIYGEQLREVTVWEKKVDYDDDGVEDTISFVIQADDAYEEFQGVTDGYELLRAPFIGNVQCISGATGELSFASGNISHDRLGNRQISYAEMDGNHYMITTEIHEQMGDGYYCYEVYSLTEGELVDSYEISFVTAGDDYRARPTAKYRQEVVPLFKEKLEKWTLNAVLIVATDVNERAEDGIFVSSFGMTYESSYYYDLVWERMLDEKVRVDNYGLQINLPEDKDWIQNPQYLLSDYPVAHIKYYDGIAEAPVLLRFGEMEHEELAYLFDMSFEEELQTVWYAGEGEERIEILCQVSKDTSEEGKKTVLVSWSYAGLNYVIFGELTENADETSLAKTAMYVVENFLKEERGEKTIVPIVEAAFETTYYSFELPEEMIGKVGYLESEDGQAVTFYHIATRESYEHGGVLGTVSLRKADDAVTALSLGGARYIGAPLVSTTQQYTSCMITTPGDVQWEPGSIYEEEFLALAAMFEARSFPGYVTLKSATRESSLTKIAKVEYDMGYQTIACEGQTILGFLDGDGQEDELYYSYVRGGELGGIYADTLVPEIIINGQEYTVTDGLQGIDFSLPVTDNVSDYYRLPYGIFDFDQNDEYREILLVSEDSTGHLLIYVFRYDAGKLHFLGNSGRLLDDSSFMVTSEGKLMVMQENGREITYRIEDNRLAREKNVVGSTDWRKEWQTID